MRKRKRQEHIYILSSSMLPAQLENYLTCETAKDMWDKIALIFEHKSATNKATLLQRFYTCQMTTSEMVVQYVTKVLNMAHALRDLDEKISDADFIAMILGSLPEKYSAFVTAWDSVDLAKQTVDTLQQRLIKEEQKLSEREERHLMEVKIPDVYINVLIAGSIFEKILCNGKPYCAIFVQGLPGQGCRDGDPQSSKH